MINSDGATHLKKYFYYLSINGVSPNGLYRQQQLSYTKIFFRHEAKKKLAYIS